MEQHISETDSLDFATYLAATGRLKFLGVVSNGGPKLKFKFLDPEDALPLLQAGFSCGATAPAMAMMATYRQLRQLMEQHRERTQHEYALR